MSFVSFVPSASAVSLGRSGAASSLAPVRGLGFSGGVVVASGWVTGSAHAGWRAVDSSASASGLAVFFDGVADPLVCLKGALCPADFDALRESVASAGLSGVSVFPVVACGRSGVAASGYFCGLAASAPGAPLSSVARGSFV